MKIFVINTLKNYDGKEILDSEGKPLSIRNAVIIALNSYLSGEVPTAEQKNKAFHISMKLYASEEVDLTLDDRAFIKERAGIILGVIVYGRVCEILEGEDHQEIKNENK